MRVGVFQCAGGVLSIDKKLSRLREAIVTNKNKRAHELDLVLCPELFASGYNVGKELVKHAEPTGGSIFDRIATLASELNTAIVYGYPEKSGDRLYNAAAFVTPQGTLLANHRKQLNSPGSFEMEYFSTGKRPTSLVFNGFTIAILICYEVEFPEAVRIAALEGAQLVLVPTALTRQWDVVASRVVPARAFENGVWLAYANHIGHENGMDYLGGSKIVAPDGKIEAQAGTIETFIATKIDINRVNIAQQRLPYLRDFKKYLHRLQAE